ncbi:1-phosphatidylinositol 4,5-bisphosphate phosphodiesterase-like [Rhizophagus irregularis DAOM 181602=DAOM 197198]|nr:1-phosphatidylinositol 4,5-bisphosphate phosphodiesterase-like [Rhizophagus irregularis DAOM 181602=DAOM 197198]
MEWYHQWESEYRTHKEEHEVGTEELDECLNCELCYPIVNEPIVFKKFWDALFKFEDAIIIYNDVTIKGVLDLLSMNNSEREDTIHKGKCRDIMDRITESIRYRIQPKIKEKGLRTIILVIVRDCIERNLENEVFDRLIGNPELIEHKYILEDWDVERRFEKFWQWYRVALGEIRAVRAEVEAIGKFKELLYEEEKIAESEEKVKELIRGIKLKKCRFLERNIEFLGHIVGNDGLRPDDKKIEKIKEMKAPTTVKEVRSFLGLCSYYRKFVKNFSKIARPISDLRKKGIPFIWGREQQEAFEKLKEKLIQYPILRHPDWKKEFLLITDASGKGLGAVLSQKDEKGKEVVIAYASRSLLPAEENYPITELECLGIVWGIQHFHKYLIDRKFKVITDHSALKGLMNAKIPKGKRARWVMELQQYNFEVIHRSGKENTNADALSRLLKIVEDQPEIVIIDGVDGLGKTSIVQNLIKEWEKQGLKVRFNTYKRRRKDKDEFYESKMETEWKFRKEVVEQINKRMLEYDEDTDIIILDKSPYCEYYYQKTKSFDRRLITPHGNHEMEKEIFRLKETIDKSIVIFLEKDGDVCWKNYIGRETEKMEKSSYPTLKKNEYLDMVKMFEENQSVYKDTKRYSRVKVKNDNSSWRKVFKEVEKWRKVQN